MLQKEIVTTLDLKECCQEAVATDAPSVRTRQNLRVGASAETLRPIGDGKEIKNDLKEWKSDEKWDVFFKWT